MRGPALACGCVALCLLPARLSGLESAPAQTQKEGLIRRTWTREHGLPDNQINAVLHGRDGYLWLTTPRGLARFDGRRFVVWNSVNTPAMGNDFCTRLVEDVEGNVWIGTREGLLRKEGNSFVRFTTKEGLADSFIVSLCPSQAGGVWVGSKEGLNCVMGNHVTRPLPTLLPPHAVWNLCEDDRGTLWFRCGELFRMQPQTSRLERLAYPDGFRHDLSFAMQPDGESGLWSILDHRPSQTTRFYRLTGAGWQVQATPPALRLYLGHDFQPLALFPTPPHWARVAGASTDPGAICCLPTDRASLWPLPQDCAQGRVLCLAQDREDNLWLGRETEGLLRWRPKYIQTLTVEDGLIHDNAWTFSEDRDGVVWIGTDGGLSRFKDGVWEHFTETNGLARNEVRALAQDQAGTLWVGMLNGLDAIQDGQIVHHRFPGEWFETKIRALCPARDGGLWVGTVRGLTYLRDGRRTKYTPADGLGAQEVRALREDRAGRLWIGTFGGGLSCLRDGQFRTVTTSNGLSSDFVWALHEDAEGVLWIGTQKGLNRLEGDRLTAFTTDQGLPDNLVNCILEDDLGCLWIGHDRGIYRVAKDALNAVAAGMTRTVTCANYDEDDGLLSIETNGQNSQPAALKTRDGRLWFATTRGVAIFDPRQLPDNTNAPTVVIEEIRANGKVIFDNGPGGTALTNIASDFALRTSEFRLPPGGAHVLEFSYTACTFVAPEKVRFKHRLIGLDRDWIDAGTERRATYLNLRPGRYRFEVAAGNKYGVWSAVPAGFTFHLAPHFWQTWWFYISCALALVGAVCAAYRWRVSELRKLHQLQQEAALLRERERLAKDLHDGLGGSLTQLTLLADLAGRAPSDTEDLPSRFQKLSRSAAEALHAVRDLIWSAHPAYDTLESLVLRICQFAENLFAASPTRCCFDLPERFPTVSLTPFQRQHVLHAAKEALNNVAKHAAASEVHIDVSVEPAAFVLTIRDNGRGFAPPNPKPEIRNPKSPAPVHGLRTMRERIEDLGGQFSLDSRPGLGTTVCIRVPWKAPRGK